MHNVEQATASTIDAGRVQKHTQRTVMTATAQYRTQPLRGLHYAARRTNLNSMPQHRACKQLPCLLCSGTRYFCPLRPSCFQTTFSFLQRRSAPRNHCHRTGKHRHQVCQRTSLTCPWVASIQAGLRVHRTSIYTHLRAPAYVLLCFPNLPDVFQHIRASPLSTLSFLSMHSRGQAPRGLVLKDQGLGAMGALC